MGDSVLGMLDGLLLRGRLDEPLAQAMGAAHQIDDGLDANRPDWTTAARPVVLEP